MIGAIVAKRVTRKAFEALERGDLDTYMNAIDDDAIFQFPGCTPISGRFEGAEAIRAWKEHWFNEMPTRRFTLHQVAIDHPLAVGPDNALLVEWTLKQTDRQGRSHVLDGVTSLTIRRGRAIHIRDYTSDQALEDIWGVRKDATSAG